MLRTVELSFPGSTPAPADHHSDFDNFSDKDSVTELQARRDETASPSTVSSTVWSFLSSNDDDQRHLGRQDLAPEIDSAHRKLMNDATSLESRTRSDDCHELKSVLADWEEDSSFTDSDATASECSISDGDELDHFECSSQPLPTAPNWLSLETAATLTRIGLKAFLRTWPGSRTRKRRGSWPSSPGCSKRLKKECFEGYVGGDQSAAIHYEDDMLDEDPRRMGKVFACPFYIRHPDHYSHCLTRVDIREIRGLLNHLCNAHIRPIYCPTCQTTFTTTRECVNHIRGRQCKLQEASHCLGITPEQVQQLSRQARNWRVAGLAPTYVTEALQWFAIWEIVFPGDEPPPRPYLSSDVDSTICAIRDFWSVEGSAIISKFLETESPRYASIRDEGQNLDAMQRVVLDHMIDAVVASFKKDEYKRLQGSEKIGKVLASLGHLFSGNH